MELSHNLKKILLAGMSALMFASVGAGTSNLTANAKRRYRPRIARRYRRPVRRYRKRAVRHHANKRAKGPTNAQLRYFASHPAYDLGYKGQIVTKYKNGKAYAKALNESLSAAYRDYMKSINPKFIAKQKEEFSKEDKVTDKEDNAFNKSVANDEVNLINKDREAHGVSDVSVDLGLEEIAKQRAKQPGAHTDSNGNDYITEDADNDGISLDDEWGENIDWYEYVPGEGSPKSYAKYANNQFMNHDANSNWEHRDNILNSDYNYVGVGVNDGKLVEDFED